MTEPQAQHPLADLAELTKQLQFQADIDRAFGVQHSLSPILPQLKLPSQAASQLGNQATGRPAQTSSPQPQNTAHQQPTNSPRAAKLTPPRPAAQASSGALFAEAADPNELRIVPPPADESEEQLNARRQANEEQLEKLFAKLAGCQLCRLCEGRTNLVFGQGDAAAEIAFVGEGPGYHEDQQGLAFVGRSGQLLGKMIRAMGLERKDVFIGNIVKCRPPDNRNPQPDEMATCLPFLERQLSIIRPRVICALGKTAGVGLGLIRARQSLTRNRGFHSWRGIRAMLTYHPAYLLRNPDDKRKAWHDLKQLMPYLNRRQEGSS